MTDPTIVAAVIGLVGVVLAAGITAVGVIVAKLISRLGKKVEVVQEQVEPNGGSKESTRHLIEQTTADMQEMRQGQGDLLNKVGTLAERADQNRDLATKALDVANQSLTIANSTADRLDRHLERWGEQDNANA